MGVEPKKTNKPIAKFHQPRIATELRHLAPGDRQCPLVVHGRPRRARPVLAAADALGPALPDHVGHASLGEPLAPEAGVAERGGIAGAVISVTPFGRQFLDTCVRALR